MRRFVEMLRDSSGKGGDRDARRRASAELAQESASNAPALSRRRFLGSLGVGGAAAVAVAAGGCGGESLEETALDWEEYFKSNYRLMTTEEKKEAVDRLERLWQLRNEGRVEISSSDAVPGVLYGYAFNISRCKGYMDCVQACVEENNCDRESGMQYIRIFEMKQGGVNFRSANDRYQHEVPVPGHFYLGTQCFHCEVPPCTEVCPVGATWKEPDGIVVVDYDWCIGCRYCEAACPYWGRRFNWAEPSIPESEINRNQHYLGNRIRPKGAMEKCTFCIQRTREGRMPACAEACPTGARVFGNLLDPDSEIRRVLATKNVFRLREDLGTEPKFWYFTD